MNREEKILIILHKVLEEKLTIQEGIIERMQELNHQIKNFKLMTREAQKEVVQSLIKDLKEFEWKSGIQEINGWNFE